MRFNLKMPEEIVKLYKEYERTKTGRELLKLSGISKEQLDIFSFFDKYFNSDLVDITLDPNGNVGNKKSNSNLIAEASNSIFKLASFIDMFTYLQKIGYSKEKAINIIKNVVDGVLYAHDQTKWSTVPYCIAVSSYNLMIEGRPYGQLHSLPPKRPDSFMAQVIEYVMDLSQEFAGAVAVGDLAINYSYFVVKCGADDKQIENDFQKFVHVVNNNFRINAQSPFTNISFFDEPTLRQIFKDYKYPDGSSPLDESYLSTIKKVQKIWMEFITKKDPKTGIPYRFPVATINIMVSENNEVLDKDFFDLYCELNKEGIFNIYIVNDGNAKIASCCFHPKQKVLVKGSTTGIELVEIGDYLERPMDDRQNWRVYHNGSWVQARPVKVPYNRKWYKVVTTNKKEIIVTDDHIHPTLEGDKKTTDLKVGDYLLLSAYPLITMRDREYLDFNYFDGFLIGAFLGDGSFGKYKGEAYNVNFCINPDKYKVLMPIIKLVAEYVDSDTTISAYQQRDTSVVVTVYGKKFVEYVKKFVGGIYNYERYPILDTVLRCKYEFRLGLIKGLYFTDGGNSNRIYTTSEKMVENLEVIFTTLGIPTVIDISDRRDEPVIIRGQEFSRNHKLYCIRFYDASSSRDFAGLYKIHNNSIYFKVVKIEELDNKEGIAYCFEIKNEEEPYFTLPNGIITHNCRLVNDITELMKYKGIDSFGNGGLNIGAHRVVTINMPRVVLDVNNTYKKTPSYDLNKYKLVRTILKARLHQAAGLLVSHRELLKDRIKQGFLKFFEPLKWLDLDRMFFSTVGLIGIYEFCELMEYDITTEEGRKFLKDILVFINDELKELSKKWGVPFNVEQIPGEGAAITLAKKDKLLYNTDYILYSNQFIPLWKEVFLTDRIMIDGELDEYFGGGVISHLNIGHIATKDQVKKVTEYAIEKGLRHFALNLVFSRCENGHFVDGNIDKCPICESTNIEKVTRIVGYFVPVKDWVKERREWEFNKRSGLDDN